MDDLAKDIEDLRRWRENIEECSYSGLALRTDRARELLSQLIVEIEVITERAKAFK